MTHGVRFRLGRLLPLECSAGTEPCDMGTNYACVPRGSLLGVYLSCTSYMTDLKIASYQYEYAALVEQPFGGGGARQLSAESPCGHPGHGAGVGLGWLEAALPALPARSIWAGTGTAARLRQPPLALMPPWESRRQKYPVRAFRCSPPATSKVALPLHHEPFSRSSSSDLPMRGACALVYLALLSDCSAILFHLLVIASLFVFFPRSLFFVLFCLFSL